MPFDPTTVQWDVQDQTTLLGDRFSSYARLLQGRTIRHSLFSEGLRIAHVMTEDRSERPLPLCFRYLPGAPRVMAHGWLMGDFLDDGNFYILADQSAQFGQTVSVFTNLFVTQYPDDWYGSFRWATGLPWGPAFRMHGEAVVQHTALDPEFFYTISIDGGTVTKIDFVGSYPVLDPFARLTFLSTSSGFKVGLGKDSVGHIYWAKDSGPNRVVVEQYNIFTELTTIQADFEFLPTGGILGFALHDDYIYFARHEGRTQSGTFPLFHDLYRTSFYAARLEFPHNMVKVGEVEQIHHDHGFAVTRSQPFLRVTAEFDVNGEKIPYLSWGSFGVFGTRRAGGILQPADNKLPQNPPVTVSAPENFQSPRGDWLAQPLAVGAGVERTLAVVESPAGDIYKSKHGGTGPEVSWIEGPGTWNGKIQNSHAGPLITTINGSVYSEGIRHILIAALGNDYFLSTSAGFNPAVNPGAPDRVMLWLSRTGAPRYARLGALTYVPGSIGPRANPDSIVYSSLNNAIYFTVNSIGWWGEIRARRVGSHWIEEVFNDLPGDSLELPFNPRGVVPSLQYVPPSPEQFQPDTFRGSYPFMSLAADPLTGHIWYTQHNQGKMQVWRHVPGSSSHVLELEINNRNQTSPDSEYDWFTGITVDKGGNVYVLASNFFSINPAHNDKFPARSEIFYLDREPGGVLPITLERIPDRFVLETTRIVFENYCHRLKLGESKLVGTTKGPQFITYLTEYENQISDPLRSFNPKALEVTLEGIGPGIDNIEQISRLKRGRVRFSFRISHPLSLPAAVEPGFSVISNDISPKVGFQEAVLAQPGNVLADLNTSPEGITNFLIWDSTKDVGFNRIETTRLRIRGNPGTHTKATPFFVTDNSLGDLPSNLYEEVPTNERPPIVISRVLPPVVPHEEIVPVLVIKGENFSDIDIITVVFRSEDESIPTMVFSLGDGFKVLDRFNINVLLVKFFTAAVFNVLFLDVNEEVIAEGNALFQTEEQVNI